MESLRAQIKLTADQGRVLCCSPQSAYCSVRPHSVVFSWR